MRIRRATAEDIALLMRLERECPTAGHWTEQQYLDLFAAAESAWQRLVLLAEQTEASSYAASAETAMLMGFLVGKPVGPEWELENIVVSPSARRTGVGNRLLDALVFAARETHSESLFLEVRESNVAARALYEKVGFRETGRRKSYYTNPLEDAIAYSFTLPE